MSPRTTLSVLFAVLVLAVPSPAAAKGPTQVEVRNLSTGQATLLTWQQEELTALMELVPWPASRAKPKLVEDGSLTHVATLDWQFEDGNAVWLDRVFSDSAGTVWIARRDYLAGNSYVTWGKVRAPYALDLMIARLGEATGATTQPAQAQHATSRQEATPRASSASTTSSASWFGLGVAVAALFGGLGLLLRRRRPGLA